MDFPFSTEGRSVELTQLCPIMQFAAADNGLPIEFFARLIWQESRLRPDAIGPVTRGGERAQGIAQFMPSTAAERSLLNPFDPARALPKSAELLRELRAQFGNLGLAAAAYNAGPQRVQDWLAGKLAQGIIGTASGIGAALSTGVFGLIAANFGRTTTFLSMAAVALLGASIMWLLMPETRPSTEK